MSIQGAGARTPPNKPRPKRVHQPKRPAVNFRLPREFEALCEREGIAAGEIIRQFVADLCDLRAWTERSAFAGNGREAHRAAQAWLAIASHSPQNKRQARAAGADVATPQPAAETRAMTPIEALTAAVDRERKDQP